MDWSEVAKRLRTSAADANCFDCRVYDSTYVVCSYGVFVCTRCAGLHRELGHRVKGLETSFFDESDVNILQEWGNLKAYSLWFGKLPSDFQRPTNHLDDMRNFFRDVYFDKKYSSQLVESKSREFTKFIPKKIRLEKRKRPQRCFTVESSENEWKDFVQAEEGVSLSALLPDNVPPQLENSSDSIELLTN